MVKNIHEDLGEDQGSWTHVNSTLTVKIHVDRANYFHANFSPTLIELFYVVMNEPVEFEK